MYRILNKSTWAGMVFIFMSAVFTACSSDDNNTPAPEPQPKPKVEGDIDWATCEVLFKEGHLHGAKFHGNPMSSKMTFPREQHCVLKKNADGTIALISGKGMEGRKYFVALGGYYYALRLVFKNAAGKVLNDEISSKENASHYQIFYTVSDLDDSGKPYVPKNIRTGNALKGDWDKKDFAARAAMSSDFFDYRYRDTNPDSLQISTQIPGGSADDVVSLLRIGRVTDGTQPQDYVGFKGYFNFYLQPKDEEEQELPSYFIAMRLLYAKATKYLATADPDDEDDAYKNIKRPLPYYSAPTEWKEVLRFNLPIRVIAEQNDSFRDPERFYEDLKREFKKSVEELKKEYEELIPDDNSSFYM